MKAFLLLAVVLTGCTERSVWTVDKADLYRVVDYSDEMSAAAQTHKPYFLIRKVVGSPDSPVSNNVVQFQVVWCDNQSTCNDRDYSLQVVQYGNAAESDRVTFESGAKCAIVRHSLVGDRITIKADAYTAPQFSPEECEAGTSASLSPKFVRTSSKVITGQLVH